MHENTATITTPTTDLPPGDPRVFFARAVALAGTTIAGVGADRLDDPTPCDEFTVRDLLRHLVMVVDKVAMIGRGEDVSAVPLLADVADDGFPAAWADGAHACQAAWSDPATLERTVVLPWTTLPGAEVLATYTNELTVHTWDLATATGQRPDWDESVLAVALASIVAELPAAGRAERFAAFAAGLPEGVSFSPPFAAAVHVDAEAPLIDRLVAHNGRRP